eukprot:522050-Rhodomonas_salina.1
MHLLTNNFANGEELQKAFEAHKRWIEALRKQNAFNRRTKSKSAELPWDQNPGDSAYKKELVEKGWTEKDIENLQRHGWLGQVFKRRGGLT